MSENPRTELGQYEQGYRDGEGSGYADWIMALSEEFEFSEAEFNELDGPQDFIRILRRRVLNPKEPSMTESMIEQVAEAMAKQVGGRPLSDNDYYTDAHREWYRKAARAAIEAMREPTAEMLAACYPRYGIPENPLYANVWRTMIDAALRWPPGSADRAGVPMAED